MDALSSQQPSIYYNFLQITKSNMELYPVPKNIDSCEAYEPFRKTVSNDFWYASACQFIVRLVKLSKNMKFNKINETNINQILFDHTTHGLHLATATTDTTNDNSEKLEIQQVVNIFNVLKDMYKKKNQILTVDQILLWHSEILVGPKRFQDFRSTWAFSEDIIFVEPKDVKSKLSHLVKEFNSHHQDFLLTGKTPIYSVISWFLHSFTLIHPFEHANGRMALLLVQFILFSFEFPCPVPFFINKYEYQSILFDNDKNFKDKKDTLTNLIIESSIRIYRNSKALQFL
ncbi:hypothetical protein DDB_G0269484 [Dictyostelium discoideum AX4]|uniref:Fido domain-containing protein n=1 Tax=Dictyostelium discoideum TaxID=44689 RepID=Q55DX8_DICDI|nr:hypothetical protein DDB_G0269484 [Dictyostelium discoideum AX4]EAL72092.1 hypothetical protein DDB_G0269484 [Dictyostelium discoideum AX4]|eukprot:XP_646003.1 hypothetical protein DDB_G0269484 [Dictyostelium discoideum AX4]